MKPFRYNIRPKQKINVFEPAALAETSDMGNVRGTMIGAAFAENMQKLPKKFCNVGWDATCLHRFVNLLLACSGASLYGAASNADASEAKGLANSSVGVGRGFGLQVRLRRRFHPVASRKRCSSQVTCAAISLSAAFSMLIHSLARVAAGMPLSPINELSDDDAAKQKEEANKKAKSKAASKKDKPKKEETPPAPPAPEPKAKRSKKQRDVEETDVEGVKKPKVEPKGMKRPAKKENPPIKFRYHTTGTWAVRLGNTGAGQRGAQQCTASHSILLACFLLVRCAQTS